MSISATRSIKSIKPFKGMVGSAEVSFDEKFGDHERQGNATHTHSLIDPSID